MDNENFELSLQHGVKIIIQNDVMQLYKKDSIIVGDKLENYIITWHKEKKVLGKDSLDLLFVHPKCKNDFQISINSDHKNWEPSIYFANNIAQKYFKKEFQDSFFKACGYGAKIYQQYSIGAKEKVVFPSDHKKQSKTYDEFYSQLSHLPGFDSWGTKKEIKYLRTMLLENEGILAIASGIMEGNTWLIACTTRRIIFVDCGMIYGVKHAEVLLDKVNAVSFKNGMVLGEIHIEDGANNRIITNVSKNSTKSFVEAVHEAIDMKRKSEQKQANNYSISKADEILKFKQLLDAGIITQEEFEMQKKRLLN